MDKNGKNAALTPQASALPGYATPRYHHLLRFTAFNSNAACVSNAHLLIGQLGHYAEHNDNAYILWVIQADFAEENGHYQFFYTDFLYDVLVFGFPLVLEFADGIVAKRLLFGEF